MSPHARCDVDSRACRDCSRSCRPVATWPRIRSRVGSRHDANANDPAKACHWGTTRTLPRILTPLEIDTLTGALRTHRDRAMVAAILLGGLRRCDVIGLHLADLHVAEKRVFVADGKAGTSGWCQSRPASPTTCALIWTCLTRLRGRHAPGGGPSPGRARLHRVHPHLPAPGRLTGWPPNTARPPRPSTPRSSPPTPSLQAVSARGARDQRAFGCPPGAQLCRQHDQQLVATMRRYLEQIGCVLRPGSVTNTDQTLRCFTEFLIAFLPAGDHPARTNHPKATSRTTSPGWPPVLDAPATRMSTATIDAPPGHPANVLRPPRRMGLGRSPLGGCRCSPATCPARTTHYPRASTTPRPRNCCAPPNTSPTTGSDPRRDVNRPGSLGGSWPWKRGWSHAERAGAWEAADAAVQPRGEGRRGADGAQPALRRLGIADGTSRRWAVLGGVVGARSHLTPASRKMRRRPDPFAVLPLEVLDPRRFGRAHPARGPVDVGLRCHSDAGSQFTSVRYGERLAEIGAIPSINRG